MSSRHTVGIVIGQLMYGGAERQTALLARELAAESLYTPVVFCLSSEVSPYGQELAAAGVRWSSPDRGRARGVHKLAWLVRSARAADCELLYGILNVGNIYAGAAARLLRLPFVGSIRSADAHLPFAVRTLSAMFCRQADWVIANSESCRRSLASDLGVTHDRVSVIPNAVVLFAPTGDARARVRDQLGVKEGDLLVGTISRVRPEKRPEFFIRVYLALRQAVRRSVHFIWVGVDGGGELLARRSTDGVPDADRVGLHFVSATPLVSDYLAAFDVFVLTSAYEGMPNALLEAMAAGLPCVATDVEGTRDVVVATSERNLCVLASRDDPAEFARSLVELVENPQEMAALGRRAQAYVSGYRAVDRLTKSYAQVFERVLQRAARRG